MGRKKKSIVLLDTHIIVWLYDALIDRLSIKAMQTINSHDVFISPIAKLELQYLYEINKIKDNSNSILMYLFDSIGLRVSNTEFSVVIDKALNINWTRDPFDRIITAEAMLYQCPLITADRNISKNFKQAFC